MKKTLTAVIAAAVLLSLGATTGAVAGDKLRSRDIKDGTIRLHDVRPKVADRFLADRTGPKPTGRWTAEGDSAVVDGDTVLLVDNSGAGTSIKGVDVGIRVKEGDLLTFRYELGDGAVCGNGAPRVSVATWTGGFGGGGDVVTETTTGCAADADGGLVTYRVAATGSVIRVGLVYDNGTPGVVLIDAVTIGGNPVVFGS